MCIRDRPNMDGIQMMEALRARGSRAYVIILTAYDSFTYARSALRLGAVDFLLKPFHDGELEAAVIKLRRRMEAERSGTAPALPERKKGDKSKYVLQAMDYIGQHYGDQNISVGEIAQHLGLSESHLSHLFRKETDYTPVSYTHLIQLPLVLHQLLLDVYVPPYQDDELGELAQRFNGMVVALKRNQEQLVENQRELNEAQIRMLQAQLCLLYTSRCV